MDKCLFIGRAGSNIVTDVASARVFGFWFFSVVSFARIFVEVLSFLRGFFSSLLYAVPVVARS